MCRPCSNPWVSSPLNVCLGFLKQHRPALLAAEDLVGVVGGTLDDGECMRKLSARQTAPVRQFFGGEIAGESRNILARPREQVNVLPPGQVRSLLATPPWRMAMQYWSPETAVSSYPTMYRTSRRTFCAKYSCGVLSPSSVR